MLETASVAAGQSVEYVRYGFDVCAAARSASKPAAEAQTMAALMLFRTRGAELMCGEAMCESNLGGGLVFQGLSTDGSRTQQQVSS